MSDIDLQAAHREQIEYELQRPLTEDELRVVASFEELSEAQRDVMRRLGPRPIGVAYLHAVVPGVREAARKLDRLASANHTIKVQAWSQEAGLGGWRFRILPASGETPRETVRRCVDTIVANARPFGRVQAVPSYTPPAELVLDLFVETESGPTVLSSVAGVTFEIVDETVELVLLLDVDIYAYVTRQYIDNAKLATVNAPRLAHFLGVLCNQLHARLIESNGLLPADETGFTAR